MQIPVISTLASLGRHIHRHKKTLDNVGKVTNGVFDGLGGFQGQSRSLEDDEGLFERDLDSAELFEREYDLFDDLD